MNRIGFACKLLAVPGTATRTCTLKHATPGLVLEIARHNLLALERTAAYCQHMGIGLFRISSDIVPFASHPSVHVPWQEALAPELAAAGAAFARAGVRVSMHPGQYTVLNSPRKDVVHSAVEDLRYHADFLDALGAPYSSKLVLHVGGVYGQRQEALKRFATHFPLLPDNVQKRLVLENDEKCFAIHEVVALCQRLGIPAVFDVLHHAVNPAPEGTTQQWLQVSGTTWKPEDGPQKIHYSQQRAEAKAGTHSATIAAAPFLEWYHSLAGQPIDIMLEVKDKNISAIKCQHLVARHVEQKALNAAWARYKYAVLERSHAAYLAIRAQFAQGTVTPFSFYEACDTALDMPITTKGAVNAAQHVWGYCKTTATLAERNRFNSLQEALPHDAAVAPRMKKFLFQCVERIGQPYLQESYYFAL